MTHLQEWAIEALVTNGLIGVGAIPDVVVASDCLGWAAVFTDSTHEAALLCHARGGFSGHSLATVELSTGPVILAQADQGAAVVAGVMPDAVVRVNVLDGAVAHVSAGWWVVGIDNLDQRGVEVALEDAHGRAVKRVVAKRVAGVAQLDA